MLHSSSSSSSYLFNLYPSNSRDSDKEGEVYKYTYGTIEAQLLV